MILVCNSYCSGVCHMVIFELRHPFYIYLLGFYYYMEELFLPLFICWIFNFIAIWSHGFFFKSVGYKPFLSFILVLKLSRFSRAGPCVCFYTSPSLSEHSCFLVHDVPGSSCTFSVPVLESAICPRSPCSFWWRMAFQNQDMVGPGF